MVYDCYRTLTYGIGWRTDKTLSEQLREERIAMLLSGERQHRRDMEELQRLKNKFPNKKKPPLTPEQIAQREIDRKLHKKKYQKLRLQRIKEGKGYAGKAKNSAGSGK